MLNKSCTTFLNRISATLVSDQVAEGRLGPSTVVLDHTSGFEGLLLVDDDLLGVSVMLEAAENGLVGLRALWALWFVLHNRSLSLTL